MEGRGKANDGKAWSMLAGPLPMKVIAIGVLTLLFMIPSLMIKSLIRERENRQKEVVREISAKMGGAQTLLGPVISVPYNSPSNSVSYMHFLPDTLHITGEVEPLVRYRGIFEAVLYNAQIMLTGSFSLSFYS